MEPMSLNRPDPRPAAVRALVPVTAVVVTRGPTPYLAATLDALARQRRAPQRVLLVDAARDAEDASALAPLAAPVPAPVTLVATPGVRTFGGAVRAALAAEAPDGDGWLWLLHDDSAPEPDALAELLAAVERAPSVAVAGAKQHTWDAPARVVEAGVTTSRFGRRMTGIDEPEVDQGQHDAREDVLGVGIAGALVRRDVWDDLGGTDPSLGPFGDGLDLSRRARLAGHRVVVVPTAVVRHARAAAEGARPDWDARRSTQARREAFLHTQLVAVPGWAVPFVAALAIVSGLVRALGRLVLKEPSLVAAELAAPWAALARVGRIARARRRAASTRRMPRRTLRPLQATWREVATQMRDRRLSATATRRARQVPSELEQREMALVRRGRRLALLAVLVAAVAADVVLMGTWLQRFVHGDRLVGGSLLLGDADLGELWRAATSWWAAAGHGAAAAPDPLWVALLPGAALAGSLGRAAGILLLAAVPLAAVGAWFAAGAATRSRALRAWAALVWAAAPALLVPVAEVRLGSVLAHVALPWVALGVARGIGVARVDAVESGLVGAARLAPRDAADEAPDDASDVPDADAAPDAAVPDADAIPADREADAAPDRARDEVTGDATPLADDPLAPEPDRALRRTSAAADPSLAAAAGAALAFVLVTAAAPVLLPAGLLAVLVLLPVARRRGRLLWLPVPALALHGPLVVAALTTTDGWRALLAEPGAPLVTSPAPSWQQLLGWPVTPDALPGPWTTAVGEVLPLVATGVVVALALPALVLRPPAGRAGRTGWVVGLVGLGAALAATRVAVGVADGATTVASAAPGLSLALAGLLAAVLPAAGNLRTALSRHSFGWRQALVGVLAIVATVGPASVLGVAIADRGDIDLTAVEGHIVPAVGRQLQQADGLRVLILEPGADGVVATVARQDGRQLTEVSRLVTATAGRTAQPAAGAAVAELAARLYAGSSTDVGADLDALGIGAVLVPPGADARLGDLAGRLDATPGLERVTATAAGTIWRSSGIGAGTAGWARVLDGTGAAGQVLVALPGGQDGRLSAALPAGTGPRVLVLAETADGDWRATLDGRSLRAVDAGWQQAFEIGPEGGHLVVTHDPPTRTPWLALQAAVLLVTVLLALPVRRRR